MTPSDRRHRCLRADVNSSTWVVTLHSYSPPSSSQEASSRYLSPRTEHPNRLHVGRDFGPCRAAQTIRATTDPGQAGATCHPRRLNRDLQYERFPPGASDESLQAGKGGIMYPISAHSSKYPSRWLIVPTCQPTLLWPQQRLAVVRSGPALKVRQLVPHCPRVISATARTSDRRIERIN